MGGEGTCHQCLDLTFAILLLVLVLATLRHRTANCYPRDGGGVGGGGGEEGWGGGGVLLGLKLVGSADCSCKGFGR